MKQCWAVVGMLLGLAVGCDRSPAAESNHTSSLLDGAPRTPVARQAWIAKAARVLRYGDGVTDPQEMARLMALPDDGAVVDELMADPRFGDAVLDFNLYFLGFKPDSLGETLPDGTKSYAQQTLAYPAAVTAARNLLTNGDYLALFDYRQPAYAGHTNQSYIEGQEALPDAERRAMLLTHIGGIYDGILASFGAPGAETLNREEGCAAFSRAMALMELNNDLFSSGVAFDQVLVVIARWNPEVALDCGSAVPAETLVAKIGAIKDRIGRIFAMAEGNTPANYPVRSVLDLKAFDAGTLDADWFGNDKTFFGFWNTLQNSSTNSNRRRAAYVLKTYFCDDLTPIDVVLPDAHAGEGAHASEPGCQSCHYKLDPMAGFFRYRGFLGYPFQSDQRIIFDDNAFRYGDEYQRYLSSWRAPEGSGHTWNVGYVRSTTNAAANTYEPEGDGEPLVSMHAIIRQAPEARQCLVRRMAEYFVGTRQVFDGGYLSSLEAQFNGAPTTAAGAKSVIKSLVMSRTFRERNPDPNTCYDPPEAENGPVPCEVSYLIERHCATCHNEAFDLADPAMLEQMRARLTSGDAEWRMPLRRDMPDTDRVRLVRWLEGRIAEGGAR